jgi:hypothetical protein
VRADRTAEFTQVGCTPVGSAIALHEQIDSAVATTGPRIMRRLNPARSQGKAA